LERETKNRLKLLTNNTGNVHADKYYFKNKSNINQNPKLRKKSQLTSVVYDYSNNFNNSFNNVNNVNNNLKRSNESIERFNSFSISSQVLSKSLNKSQVSGIFENYDNVDFMRNVSIDNNNEFVDMFKKNLKSNYSFYKKNNEGEISDNNNQSDDIKASSELDNSNLLKKNNNSIIFEKKLFNNNQINKTKNESKNEKEELLKKYSYFIKSRNLKYSYDNKNTIQEEDEEIEEDNSIKKDTLLEKNNINKTTNIEINKKSNNKSKIKSNNEIIDENVSDIQRQFLKNTYIMRIIDSAQDEYKPKKVVKRGKPINISERPRWVFGRGEVKNNYFNKGIIIIKMYLIISFLLL